MRLGGGSILAAYVSTHETWRSNIVSRRPCTEFAGTSARRTTAMSTEFPQRSANLKTRTLGCNLRVAQRATRQKLPS